MQLVAQPGLPAALVVARPTRADRAVLVVVDPATPAGDVLDLSAMLLRDGEREQLARFLSTI
jgi:hypothetical protein